MAGDDVTITIRADDGQAVRAFRDVNGRLRDMRGRFVSEGAAMSGADEPRHLLHHGRTRLNHSARTPQQLR
ncbi:hypothetical protein SGLAM104S_01638 [Streptomyces glaucescens]